MQSRKDLARYVIAGPAGLLAGLVLLAILALVTQPARLHVEPYAVLPPGTPGSIVVLPEPPTMAERPLARPLTPQEPAPLKALPTLPPLPGTVRILAAPEDGAADAPPIPPGRPTTVATSSSAAGVAGDNLSDRGPVAPTPEAVIAPPKLMHQIQPDYPVAARLAQQEGYVEVEFAVSAAGRAIKPRVIGAEPVGVFEQVSLAALGRWEFTPSMIDGTPVESGPIKVRIEFQLGQ